MDPSMHKTHHQDMKPASRKITIRSCSSYKTFTPLRLSPDNGYYVISSTTELHLLVTKGHNTEINRILTLYRNYAQNVATNFWASFFPISTHAPLIFWTKATNFMSFFPTFPTVYKTTQENTKTRNKISTNCLCKKANKHGKVI